MHARSIAFAAIVPLAFVAGCGDKIINEVSPVVTTATVLFVNATSGNIDVLNSGVIESGNGNIAFGGNSSCMVVDNTGAAGTGLVFNNAGTSTAIPGFTQNFTNGGNFTVVAFPSTTGATEFLTIDNTGFVPASGEAGLRIVNLVPQLGNIVVSSNGTVLGSGAHVGFGAAGEFMSVAAGAQDITFTTAGTPTTVDAGTLTLNAGQNYTLFVAPSLPGGTTPHTFLVTGC